MIAATTPAAWRQMQADGWRIYRSFAGPAWSDKTTRALALCCKLHGEGKAVKLIYLDDRTDHVIVRDASNG